VTVLSAAAAQGGEEIYFRKDSNGALVLTNVPDHQDLRAYLGKGPVPGTFDGEVYRALIQRTALRHGVHPDLVYAMASVESSFNPRAVSAKGAQGLMQLMPDTAARFGVADPFDPVDNVLGGVRYLRYLLDLFNGDQRLAIAAYNAGENIVLASRGVPPYRETQDYVRKVLRLFGSNKRPYVTQPRRTLPGGQAVQSPIYSTTDAQGVVHVSDIPPAEAQRPAPGATPERPH
jgi:hypothetical protein